MKDKTISDNQAPEQIITRQQDGSIEINITLPSQTIKSAYSETLQNLAKNIEVKGFRRGKAPLKLAEKQINKETVFEEILKKLIPGAYLEIIKANNIKPIINPQIKIISAQEDKDWIVKAITCEAPKVTLGDYQNLIKKSKKTEIWLPDGKTKGEKENNDQRIDSILKSLLDSAECTIPQLLIDEEVNRMLSRLIQQTEKLGITVEQYVQSTNKTLEQLKEEYVRQATDTLKLEFILAYIAQSEKIEIADEDIDKMIAAVPDEPSKQSLKNPQQRAYIAQILKKQRVIDKLLAL